MNKTRLISIFCGTAITFQLLYMTMQETVWKFQSKSNFVWRSKIYIFCQVQKKIAHICESFSEGPKILFRFFIMCQLQLHIISYRIVYQCLSSRYCFIKRRICLFAADSKGKSYKIGYIS